MEKRVVATEKARDSYHHKVGILEGKFEESDTKLAQALSKISAKDRELEVLKADLEQAEQKYYDKGFDDAEHFSRKVIFEDRWKGFMDGWMAVVNAFNLPFTSPFRDTNQVPLPEDPEVEVQVVESPMLEEEDSPSMWELVE